MLFKTLELCKKRVSDISRTDEDKIKPVIIRAHSNNPIKKLIPVLYDKAVSSQYTRFTMPVSHFAGHNMWLLKPAGFNRGRGIHVFCELEKLQNLLASYSHEQKEASLQQTYMHSSY